MKTMSEEDETLDGCGCDMSSAKGKHSSAYNKAWSWKTLLSFHFCLLDSAWSMRCCVDLCFRVLKRLVSSIPPIKKKKRWGGEDWVLAVLALHFTPDSIWKWMSAGSTSLRCVSDWVQTNLNIKCIWNFKKRLYVWIMYVMLLQTQGLL